MRDQTIKLVNGWKLRVEADGCYLIHASQEILPKHEQRGYWFEAIHEIGPAYLRVSFLGEDQTLTLLCPQHQVIRRDQDARSGGVAICEWCGDILGWWCPDSPSHLCQYDWETQGENCIYCGEPQERK